MHNQISQNIGFSTGFASVILDFVLDIECLPITVSKLFIMQNLIRINSFSWQPIIQCTKHIVVSTNHVLLASKPV